MNSQIPHSNMTEYKTRPSISFFFLNHLHVILFPPVIFQKNKKIHHDWAPNLALLDPPKNPHFISVGQWSSRDKVRRMVSVSSSGLTYSASQRAGIDRPVGKKSMTGISLAGETARVMQADRPPSDIQRNQDGIPWGGFELLVSGSKK